MFLTHGFTFYLNSLIFLFFHSFYDVDCYMRIEEEEEEEKEEE